MARTAEGPRIVALIPARGGSRSIPLKNVALLGGRPLVYWAAAACSGSRRLAATFVSTDSPAIRDCVEGFRMERVHVIGRSPATATDEASTESALLEFAGGHDCDHVVLVQATSPLLESADLDRAIEMYLSSGADSLVSVVRSRRFLWEERGGGVAPLNYDPRRRPRRQEWGGLLVENGAFTITSRERLLESGCRVSGRIVGYEMRPATLFELDEPEDWPILEALLGSRARGPDLALLASIRALCVDVDGTLTDGGMYYSEQGESMKRFQTRDAMGMSLLRRDGVVLALVTSEDSPIVLRRAQKLEIEHVFLGVQDKESCLDRFLAEQRLRWEELAFVGDDLNDLGAFRRAGFAACPADAVPEVLRGAHHVCRNRGGRGAVREVCDLIREARRRSPASWDPGAPA
jgi:N-acylneuraminate cytidylyltransferase